ncbi:glucose 1-dehydrogenase [Variovorax robiniae]|uniref:Glucose 1-dehydrogenase n=1 Tax=Variovorax robiniae TaxID=1836199 RepID=A0ABU8X636_9BURK
MTKSLEGKTALVTGAAQGMGLAFAEALAEAGAHVALTDVLAEEVGVQAARLAARGLSVQSHALDVTNKAAWAEVMDALAAAGRSVDVLVNNAGIAVPGSIEECSVDTWRRTMDINALGPLLGCQAVIPGMKTKGGGSIINISSIFGLVGEPRVVAYCASKGAVTQLTRSAAVQLAPYGIRVNSVHPGFVATPMVLGAMKRAPAAIAQEYEARTVGQTPIGRMAEPEDVAGAVVFLASDASRYMTAGQMVIDGGFIAR